MILHKYHFKIYWKVISTERGRCVLLIFFIETICCGTWLCVPQSECEKVRQEDLEFKASLVTKRLYLKKQKALFLEEWEDVAVHSVHSARMCELSSNVLYRDPHTLACGYVSPCRVQTVITTACFPQELSDSYLWNGQEKHSFHFWGEKHWVLVTMEIFIS